MNYTVLGDPHLGRKFVTGVPLHRIGEREAMVRADFEKSLQMVPTEYHVCMGDLFDKFIVPPEVVLYAADTYLAAAITQPDVTFIVLMGNHDPSKDATKRSSFEIFRRLVEQQVNILVVTEPQVIGGMGFVPYSVFGSAAEGFQSLPVPVKQVFGHFDVVDWGGANVVPTALMAEAGVKHVITGHDHLRRDEKRHGVHIEVVGSLQPYTHAEDADGTWYRTVTLEQLGELDVGMLNVRVLLNEGETLPEDLDCLSLIAKRVASVTEQAEEVDTTEFDNFDLNAELSKILPESIRAEILEIVQS